MQWLSYYLCNNKFALHTHIPLHICKSNHSNLHQICNGCFIIFATINLHYIYTHLCTCVNLTIQICINLPWMFYYLCHIKFSLHTHIPLHNVNSVQICTAFAMVVLLSLSFVILNLHYIHTPLNVCKFNISNLH